MNNMPPSANGTLDDLSGLGVLAGDVKVRELMTTMGRLMEKFCYVYVRERRVWQTGAWMRKRLCRLSRQDYELYSLAPPHLWWPVHIPTRTI